MKTGTNPGRQIVGQEVKDIYVNILKISTIYFRSFQNFIDISLIFTNISLIFIDILSKITVYASVRYTFFDIFRYLVKISTIFPILY